MEGPSNHHLDPVNKPSMTKSRTASCYMPLSSIKYYGQMFKMKQTKSLGINFNLWEIRCLCKSEEQIRETWRKQFNNYMYIPMFYLLQLSNCFLWVCLICSSNLQAPYFLKKLKTELPYYPEIPLLGIYPEKTIIQKDTYTPLFFAALFTITRIQK